MEIYLVGGAVRDQLLNLPIKDRDWVVIGATPQEMLDLGYQQVGKDFPVFLHPDTHEEYALGRIERKSGRGHQAFVFDFAPEVTIEEDLSRRDLTINAIAQSADGQLIDPYHGVQDIQEKRLGHVSQAFVEDPLRVLRVFRFLARFANLGFKVADETLLLCKQIVDDGEMDHLTAERVWQECEKALQYQSPQCFFYGLYQVGALFTITQSYDITEDELDQMNQHLIDACQYSDLPEQRFAMWVGNNAFLYEQLQAGLPLPSKYKKWIEYLIKGQTILENWQTESASSIWKIFKMTGGLRAEGDLLTLLRLFAFDESSMTLFTKMQYELIHLDIQKIQNEGYSGAALGEALKNAQLSIIEYYLNNGR